MATARLDTAGIVDDGKNLKQVGRLMRDFKGSVMSERGGKCGRKEKLRGEKKEKKGRKETRGK